LKLGGMVERWIRNKLPFYIRVPATKSDLTKIPRVFTVSFEDADIFNNATLELIVNCYHVANPTVYSSNSDDVLAWLKLQLDNAANEQKESK
jgi:hypothetical protein